MKLIKIEYLFNDETEELENEQWRSGLVVQYEAGDEIDKAYTIMDESGDVKPLDKVLNNYFGLKDDDIIFYTEDLEGLADSQDIIINSTEEMKG